MKRFIYSVLPVLFCLQAVGQKEYFIFIQHTSGQPFYVRMGDRSFSSSSGAYLTLGGLTDSVYELNIGFPANMVQEQLFTVPVKQKDRGFELKNMNGVWELFDLQTLIFIKPVVPKEKDSSPGGAKKTDSYSQLMAGVVDDSAVLYSSVVKQQPVKSGDNTVTPHVAGSDAGNAAAVTDPAGTKETADTVLVKTVPKKDAGDVKETKDTALAKVASKKDTVAIKAAPAKDTIAKVSEMKDTAIVKTFEPKSVGAISHDIVRYSSENVEEGKLIIFIDRTAPVSDTVTIIIPRL